MRYEILDDKGAVINTIIASPEFVQAQYAGHFRQAAVPDAAGTAPPVLVPKDLIVERCAVDEWQRFSNPASFTADALVISKVRKIYDLFMTKTGDVNVASPRAAAMGQALVTLGVIVDPARVAVIFAAP